MSQPADPVIHAAEILAARRCAGSDGERLPQWCRPRDIAEALAIQRAVAERLGEATLAWKCGMPNSDGVVLAPIFASTIHHASPCPVWSRDGQVRVEPELAFILGRDLPPRATPYAPAEIAAAIAGTHLALELIASRYREPAAVGFAENLADGLLNQGLFIGTKVDDARACAAAGIDIRVSDGSGAERRFDGRHPNAAPRAPLYWLAEFLRANGQGLRAGQAVITGSYAGSFDLALEQEHMIRYGELGMLKVRFSQR